MPVSLIGTFAGLHLLGYSINTLTLFGMVLAIGIVVDDAIVVLENVERIMHEQKKSAYEAAIQAMHEVTGPVIAIVLVLTAVFVPIAFLGGLSGELYRQFAITISIAVIISGIRRADAHTGPVRAHPASMNTRASETFSCASTSGFTRSPDVTVSGVAWMLKRSALVMLLFGGMVLITAGMWKVTPGSLVPDEDQGYYIVSTHAARTAPRWNAPMP